PGLTPGPIRGQVPGQTGGQVTDLTGDNAINPTRGQTPDLTPGQTPDLTPGLTPVEIVQAAGRGDADAEAALRRYESRMARALAHVINILDPDVIVLGGGMSNIERLYVTVPQMWTSFVFSDR